ncbi:hypothetical protein AGMMS49938_14170 [Fibrobacterales bacterium]|nr:hypothetical protein AGMMS49938_14170 [Fibrobacterales bacterium]
MTIDNIVRVWLTDDAAHIQTADGRTACEYFSNYPRLASAEKTDLFHYEVNAFGIRWEKLDEDLGFDGFLRKSMDMVSYAK